MVFIDELDDLISKTKADGVDLDTIIADLQGTVEGLIAEIDSE